MTDTLTALIASAAAEARQQVACADGTHHWRSIGGRHCPHPEDIGNGTCSQPVYECAICGDTDYGYRGGPGHAACMDCHRKWDASDFSWWERAAQTTEPAGGAP